MTTDRSKYTINYMAKRDAIIQEGGKQFNVLFDAKYTRWLDRLRKLHPAGTYKAVFEKLIADEIKRLRDAGHSK